MEKFLDWNPTIEIESHPTLTTTLFITVTGVNADALEAQLITPIGESSLLAEMEKQSNGAFSVSLSTETGAFYGHVYISGIDANGNNLGSSIIPFENLSGWDGKNISWGGKNISWGGKNISWGGKNISWGGKNISWGAPTHSDDGQVSILPLKRLLNNDVVYQLTRVASPADFPRHLTPVGQGYKLNSSGTNTEDASTIIFNYLSNDITGGSYNEQFIDIYFLPSEGGSPAWKRLTSDRDQRRNIVWTTITGEGTYILALARDFDPLLGNQWNQTIYPIEFQQIPIVDALASIEGKYRTVAQYNSTDASWDIYDTTITPPFEAHVNTLTELAFGNMWIYMNETVTETQLPVDYPLQQAVASNPNTPPMTVYGWLELEGENQSATISAVIEGQNCGQVETATINSRTAYKIQIAARNSLQPEQSRCGVPGTTIQFFMEDTLLFTLPWDNTRSRFINLPDGTSGLDKFIYLPLIRP